jgi:hypothetical protein
MWWSLGDQLMMHVDKQKTNIKIYISQFHKQEFVQFEILKKNI